MSDSAPAKSGRYAAIELRGKPVAHGVYASERLSRDEAGKIAQGQSWLSRGTLFDSRVVALFESAPAAARSNSRDAIFVTGSEHWIFKGLGNLLRR